MHVLAWIIAGLVPVGVAVSFIPKELWRRWRGRIVDKIELGLRRRFSRFARHYREFVLTKQRLVDLKGLATVGFYNPELAEVFVDVSLAYRAPHEIPASVLARVPLNVTDRHSIQDFLNHSTPFVLAVIGAAGSGKTTLLRHTAHSICRARGQLRTVPILLYLRDHVTALTAGEDVALPSLVRSTLGRYAVSEPPGWFEQRLVNGDCVVLLDGLDEIAAPEDRRQISNWVQRVIEQYPKNDWVISSRPEGYRAAPISGALVVQVRSFTDEQVSLFLDRWFLAVEKQRSGSAGDEVARLAAVQSHELLNKVQKNQNLRDLSVNPLLLTMIANVHLYRGALPGSRAELYREICEVLLWRRGESKGLTETLAGDKKTILLNALAFEMMQSRVRDISHAALIEKLTASLRRMSTPLAAEEFLQEILSYGIIVERENDQFAFAHLTFQESLAAAHIRSKGIGGILVASVNDSWWRETSLLYVAQSDADAIVRACLEARTVAAWSLAFDCADQSGDLSSELRNELDNLLETNYEDPALERLRVGVQVTRYLNANVGVSTGERVCQRPVRGGLYRLFLDDVGWGHKPDGPMATADQFVTGVRGSDAQKFAEWVNSTASGGTGCKLPNAVHIAELAQRNPDDIDPQRGVWTIDADRRALWKQDDLPSNRTSAEQMRNSMARDYELLKTFLDRLTLVELSRILTKYIPSVKEEPLRVEMIEISLHYRQARKLASRVAERITAGLPDHVMTAVDALAFENITESVIAPLPDLITQLNNAIGVAAAAGSTYASFASAGATPEQEGASGYSNMMKMRLDAVVTAWNLRQAIPKLEEHFLLSALREFVGEPEEKWSFLLATTLAQTIPEDVYRRPIVFDDVLEIVKSGSLLNDSRLSDAVSARVDRLIAHALPLFERRTEISPSIAAGVRLSALCLANDVINSSHQHDLRYLACATTMLELRMRGVLPATETIVLAIT